MPIPVYEPAKVRYSCSVIGVAVPAEVSPTIVGFYECVLMFAWGEGRRVGELASVARVNEVERALGGCW
jgi:hypothetical protein